MQTTKGTYSSMKGRLEYNLKLHSHYIVPGAKWQPTPKAMTPNHKTE